MSSDPDNSPRRKRARHTDMANGSDAAAGSSVQSRTNGTTRTLGNLREEEIVRLMVQELEALGYRCVGFIDFDPFSSLPYFPFNLTDEGPQRHRPQP